MVSQHFISIVLSIFALVLAGLVLAYTQLSWYEQDLLVPPIAPDRIVFTLLWCLMGIAYIVSAYIAFKGPTKDAFLLSMLTLLLLSGFFYSVWLYVFFILHSFFAARCIGLLVEALTILLILVLWSQSKTAALVLLPVLFCLIYFFYVLNELWLLNEAF
jgi:tryptophan-rich sensory protein